jgi:hypothetical protein
MAALLPPALFAPAELDDERHRPCWQTPDVFVGRPTAELEARAAAISQVLAEPALSIEAKLGLLVELEAISELLATRQGLA